MGGGDVAVCDEDLVGANDVSGCCAWFGCLMDTHHVGDRSSGKDDSTDELADKVEAAVLVCDSHDDADGYEKEGGNGKGE